MNFYAHFRDAVLLFNSRFDSWGLQQEPKEFRVPLPTSILDNNWHVVLVFLPCLEQMFGKRFELVQRFSVRGNTVPKSRVVPAKSRRSACSVSAGGGSHSSTGGGAERSELAKGAGRPRQQQTQILRYPPLNGPETASPAVSPPQLPASFPWLRRHRPAAFRCRHRPRFAAASTTKRWHRRSA